MQEGAGIDTLMSPEGLHPLPPKETGAAGLTLQLSL